MRALKQATMLGLIALVSASVVRPQESSAQAAVAEPQAAAELVVIVSDAVPLKDLSLTALRRVFAQAKLSLPGGITLIAINAPPHSPEREHFDRVVLKMEPEEVGRYWIDQKIRGKALPPKVVPSRAMAGKIVQKLEGAITYVPANQVPPGTHALTIDGHKAGDQNYPLRAP